MDIVIYKAKKARFTSLKILAQLPLHLLCQTLERALVDILTTMVANVLQPRQFAYKSDRDTDDTVLVLSDLVSKQLTVTKGYARVLFDDYSAAFNSLKLHTLLTQLANLNTDMSFILWIRDFLSCRLQRILTSGTQSGMLTIRTGCPQGRVLSPLLFSLPTNDFALNNDMVGLIK